MNTLGFSTSFVDKAQRPSFQSWHLKHQAASCDAAVACSPSFGCLLDDCTVSASPTGVKLTPGHLRQVLFSLYLCSTVTALIMQAY